MQWAIRARESRPARATGGVRVAGTGSLVFIDPATLRRSSSAAVAQAQANAVCLFFILIYLLFL